VAPRRRFLLGLILVLGAALRRALHLFRPSFSIDETMLGTTDWSAPEIDSVIGGVRRCRVAFALPAAGADAIRAN
jgi:hypothetical protein